MIGTKKPADDHEPIQTKSRYEDPWVMCQECAESIAYRLASRLTELRQRFGFEICRVCVPEVYYRKLKTPLHGSVDPFFYLHSWSSVAGRSLRQTRDCALSRQFRALRDTERHQREREAILVMPKQA